MTVLRISILATFVVLMACPPVSAGPPFELSAGYSVLSYSNCCLPTHASTSKGWTSTVAIDLSSWVSVVGEGGGDYFSVNQQIFPVDVSYRIHSILGGPRVTKRLKGLTVFGQALLGTTHRGYTTQFPNGRSSGGQDFLTYQPGFGVDLGVSRHLALRLAADYRMTRMQGLYRGTRNNEPRFADGTLNEPRFSSGLVWRP